MEVNSEKPSDTVVSFPEGTSSFSFQVGGHIHGEGRLKLGVLKHKNGYLVKPLYKDDSRSGIELSFYRTVHESCNGDSLLEILQSFIPKYYGVWETKLNGKDIKYLCIEDLCDEFQSPSILDIKMGCVTYDDDASEDKKNYEISKYAYGETTGIRFVGMKVFNDALKKYDYHGKSTLRAVKLESLPSAFEMYLSKNIQVNIWLLCGMIHKLDEICKWFTVQTRYKFIASSILHVYEGIHQLWFSWTQEQNIPLHNTVDSTSEPSQIKVCQLCGETEETCSKLANSPLIRVSMIDFGHARPSNEIDTNYLPGIQNLVDYFKQLLNAQRDLYSSTFRTEII